MNSIVKSDLHSEEFKRLANSMAQFVWLADPQGKVFWFNKCWHEYTGVTQAQLNKNGWASVPHPAQIDFLLDSFQKSIESGNPWEETFLMRRADGKWRWFLTQANPLRDEKGKILGWIGTNTNITKQKMAEEDLIKSETRYKYAALASKDVIWDLDLSTNKIEFNQALVQELKHPASCKKTDLRWWERHIHPEDRIKVYAKLKGAIDFGKTEWRDEYRFLKGDGEYAVIFDRGYIIKDAQGRSCRMIGAMQDVTSERVAMEQIKIAKVAAEEANSAKSAFLANMSHEVRTPLSAIMGFVELIKMSTQLNQAELQDFLNIIQRNADQLLRIIDDVLDLTRVESGKFSVQDMDFSFDELLRDFSALMKKKAREKGLNFYLEKDPNVPDVLKRDPVRIKQIMINMVDNSLKFTEQGDVKLQLKYEEPYLFITVEDSGIGISSGNRDQIFEPFEQGDASNSKKYGGTGLGLPLTKNLCQAMGGDFYLKSSQVGKGSVFEAKIFIERGKRFQSEEKGGGDLINALKDLKVLVIDDSPDNRVLIKELLSRHGARVDLAAKGTKGVGLAKDKNYDVILVDIQMPGMDGYQVLAELKKEKIQSRVVALTAHAMKEERNRAYQEGFNAFITKPFKLEEALPLIGGSRAGL